MAEGERTAVSELKRKEEDRFARQDSRRYSGWSSAITIAVIVIILAIVIIVYQLKY